MTVRKLSISNLIDLPEIFVADTQVDADICKRHRLDYILRPKGWNDFTLVYAICLPFLKKEYPYVNWESVFIQKTGKSFKDTIVISCEGGKGTAHKSEDGGVADIATEERLFSGGVGEDYYERELLAYLGDKNSKVHLDVIESLKFMPPFMSNIATAILKTNPGYNWEDGYNKKHDVCIGTHHGEYQLPNLIILDVSGSIPRGISATLIALIESIRHLCDAELIITGSTSYYWSNNDDLPTPEEIRNKIGYDNEATMFFDILKTHIEGREWGNIIVFGDDDTPDYFTMFGDGPKHFNAEVHKLLSFHTKAKKTPGYAQWIHRGCETEDFEEIINTNWCSIIYND